MATLPRNPPPARLKHIDIRPPARDQHPQDKSNRRPNGFLTGWNNKQPEHFHGT